VDQIIFLRRIHPLKSIDALQKLKYISPKSSPFLLVNGKSPAKQLDFFLFAGYISVIMKNQSDDQTLF